jgi:hypothetical protein
MRIESEDGRGKKIGKGIIFLEPFLFTSKEISKVPTHAKNTRGGECEGRGPTLPLERRK